MEDNLKLDNQLCFPLYVCSKEIIRKYKPYLEKLNLTYTQFITMMVLWEENEINVKRLGERLFLDSGTLTPLLKKLENKGYLERIKNNKDERNLNIKITLKGKELKKLAKDIPFNVGKCLNLSEQEALDLYKTLYKIIKNIN